MQARKWQVCTIVLGNLSLKNNQKAKLWLGDFEEVMGLCFQMLEILGCFSKKWRWFIKDGGNSDFRVITKLVKSTRKQEEIGFIAQVRWLNFERNTTLKQKERRKRWKQNKLGDLIVENEKTG